jgi:lysozyme family protein
MAEFNLNDRLVPFIIGMEGGWVNDPADKGGETNRGITLGTFNFLCKRTLGLEPTHELFMSLSREQVALFVKWYWDDVRASEFYSQAVAEYVTDWNWGSGLSAKKCLQRVLTTVFRKNLSVDGIIGPASIEAANSVSGPDLLAALYRERIAFYERIAPDGSTNARFRKGWKNRASAQYNLVKTVA